MNLRTKFVLVLFMFCLAVCINISAAVYYSNFRLGQATNVYEPTYKTNVFVHEVLLDIRRQNQVITGAMQQGEISEQQRDQIKALTPVIKADAARVHEYNMVVAKLADPDQLREVLAVYDSAVQDYLQMSATGQVADQFKDTYRAGYDTLEKELLSVQLALSQSLNRDANVARDAVNVYYLLFAMVIAEIVVLVIIFSLFRGWMLRPIEAIRVATEEIAAGNLDYRLEPSSQDELGALSREVNHMAASLSTAQRQLKQKERMAAMGEMVSVVAHNIRNPLAGIRATAQTSLHDLLPDSTIALHLQRIIASVDSLEQWLKELLHLNRPIELNIEATNIDELVEDLTQIFQPSTQRKNVDICYEPSRPQQHIAVDRQHFVQAMASLLDNAIEAAPHGSAVRIKTGEIDVEGKHFFIDISDAGCGVPDALRKQIFEPYFSTKPGGTGIGLSMARKIIEAHSGRLSIDNGNGSTTATAGATFHVEIPILATPGSGANTHG